MPTSNPIPSYDPSDLLFNAEKLDEVVNSTANSYTDRMGVERRTLAALEAEFPNAQANAAAAAAAATQAANEATSAATAVGLAFNEATAAQASRVAAEAARDAAQLSAGVYATMAAGLAATVSGQYFSVPSSSSYEYLILYQNSSGTAVEVKPYPSVAAVTQISNKLLDKADLMPGKNLFNINSSDVVLGYFVSSLTGSLEIGGGFNSTGFIPVVAGSSYALSYKHNIAWYNSNKNYISGSPSTDTAAVQNAPAGAAYLRCSVATGSWSSFQVETGSVVSAFEPYLAAVPTNQIQKEGVISEKIGFQAVTPTKTNFLLPGKNLFNINDGDVALGNYVSYFNGGLFASASYNVTGFIPVTAGSSYTVSFKHQIAWYDESKHFISGSPSTDTVKTQTAPAGAKYLRCSVATANWPTFQAEAGSSQTAFKPYQLTLRLAAGTPVNVQIPDGSITPVDVSFLPAGKNKFNKDSATIGYYVSNTGSLLPNAAYDVSDYIPVTAGVTYCTNSFRFTCFYDAEKNVVAGGSSVTGTTFTVPAGAVFVRVTLAHGLLATYQVETGTSPTVFESYGYILQQPGGYPIRIDPASNPAAVNPAPEMVMPPTIYGVVGRECNVYLDNLHLSDADSYIHDVTSASGTGQQQNERWTWTPTSAMASGSLTVAAHEKRGGTMLATKTAQQRAAASSAGTGANKKVLVVGDSLINAGTITQTLIDVAATDVMGVTLLGTRGAAPNRHEGRGGWTINDYATAGRTYYSFTASGVVTPPAINSTTYTNNGNTFTVQELNLVGGAGTIVCSVSPLSGTPTASGTLTKTSGSGDATIAFSASSALSGNPFWLGGAINFAQYLTNNSIAAPDWVIIGLGINDCFSQTDDTACSALADTELAKLDTLIASIKAADANTKIGLMLPSPPSADQDAFGASYGTGQPTWRFRRNILIWAWQMIAKYAGQESGRVYLVPSNTALDTVNNMNVAASAPVNSRSTVTKTRQNNGVHPGVTGYQQIGDAVWAFLKYYA